MSKIILKNTTKGWFSIALRLGLSVELKPDDIYVINNASDGDVFYYNQFIPLGVSVRYDKEQPIIHECLNEPLIDGLVEDNTNKDYTKYNEIDDLKDCELPSNSPISSEDDLDSLTKNQIRDILTRSNVHWSKKATKAELIELMRSGR